MLSWLIKVCGIVAAAVFIGIPGVCRATVSGSWSSYGPTTGILTQGRLNAIDFTDDHQYIFAAFAHRFASDAASQIWYAPTSTLQFSPVNNTGLDGTQMLWVRSIVNSAGSPVCVQGVSGPLLHHNSGVWQSASLPAGETIPWNTQQGGSFVRFPNGTIYFLARYNVLKSTDGGASFSAISNLQNFTKVQAPFCPAGEFPGDPTYLTNGPAYAYYGYCFLFTCLPWGEMVVAGESPCYWHSLDEGLTWSPMDPTFRQCQRDSSGVPWYMNRRWLSGGNIFGCGYLKTGEMVLSHDPNATVSIYKQHPDGTVMPMSNGLPSVIAGFGAPPVTLPNGEMYFWTGYPAGGIPSGRPPNDIYGFDGTTWNVVTPALGQGGITTTLLGKDGNKLLAASGSAIVGFTTSNTLILPNIDLGTSQTVTFPNPATITAAPDQVGNYSYEWTVRDVPDVTLSNPSSATTQVYFPGPGQYVVNCIATSGTVRAGNCVIVHVNPAAGAVAPSISAHPANAVLAVGSPASFSFTLNSGATGPLAYQWYKDGLAIPGATAATYNTPPCTSSDMGASYGCQISGPGGRIFTNSGTLGQVPVIALDPQDQTVAAGQNVTFTAVATGITPLQYQWYDNGAAISGTAGQQASYTLSAVDASKNGHLYSVKVTNLFGNVTSANATLTVSAGTSQFVTVNYPGFGTGYYAPGTKVGVTAPAFLKDSGTAFVNWSSTGGTVASPFSTTTYITLPNTVGATIYATPNYAATGSKVLTVVNGAGGGKLSAGNVATITAGVMPPGQSFHHWDGSAGVMFGNANSATTTVTMPNADARVVAVPSGAVPVEVSGVFVE